MATIAWVSVFVLLVIELFITFLLVLPLPRAVRRFLARKIFTYRLGQRIRYFANFVIFALCLAIADAISSLRQLNEKEVTTEGPDNSKGYADGRGSYISETMLKQRKFRAERNVSCFEVPAASSLIVGFFGITNCFMLTLNTPLMMYVLQSIFIAILHRVSFHDLNSIFLCLGASYR